MDSAKKAISGHGFSEKRTISGYGFSAERNFELERATQLRRENLAFDGAFVFGGRTEMGAEGCGGWAYS